MKNKEREKEYPRARSLSLVPPKPIFSASLITSLAGSAPGLKIKITGESGELFSYISYNNINKIVIIKSLNKRKRKKEKEEERRREIH